MTRWNVVFEEYDNFGNQGIGTEIIDANNIDEALNDINELLIATYKANTDRIACWRVIGINIMPEFKENMGGDNHDH